MDKVNVRLDRLTKRFGPLTVVKQISLDVAGGEFVTLLGPSGCGKTTTLRMIAGLETADDGAIYIGDVPVVSVSQGINLPPEQRNIGMVFQSYAIWPHMTVAENVGFPLKLRRVPSLEIRDRVRRALDLIGLPGFEDRPAARLSGGQQQRVALARALIYEPGLLLLDEPLSNLDAKLREQMQTEVRLLQERLGLTVVYVTHDQTEALSMSDRIAVMNLGQVEQLGAPRELYERPATAFVRDFLGKSVILSGKVRNVDGGRIGIELGCNSGAIFVCHKANGHSFAPGHEVEISVRPEAVRAETSGGGENVIEGVVETVLYQGERTECGVRVGTESIMVFLPPQAMPMRGKSIALSIAPDSISVWPKG